jgi:hypothetical protein
MSRPQITTQIDARNLNGALRQLARISGKDFKDVVSNETLKILETAMRGTSAASVGDIRSNVEKQQAGWYSAGDTKRPSTARTDGQGRRLYWLGNRYPAAIWAQIQAERAKNLKERLAARGLLKKGWYQLAADLGKIISAPAYVKKATTPNGDYPEDASANETGEGSKYTITGTLSRTYDRRIYTALRKAINKRTAYFVRSLKKGLLDNSKLVAARYPGLYVKS